MKIGTGTGLIALNTSKTASAVVATDINPYAIKCARANALLNEVENIDIRQKIFFNQ